MKRSLLAVPVVLLLAVAGCGTSGGNDGPDDPTTTSSTTVPGGGTPSDPDKVVWQESTGGGFVPSQVSDGEVPDVTIYADGRIIVTVPDESGRYDRPAELEQGQISAEDLDAFLATAVASGLFEPGTDFGTPGVTDQSSTSVTLAADGPPRTVNVYALGFEFPADMDPEATGVSEEAVANRAELIELTDAARALAVDTEPYVPSQVRATKYDVGEGVDPPAGSEWPGPPFSAFPEPTDGSDRSCLVIEGDDARAVYDAALQNPSVTWTSGGESHQIVIAPMLPGQEGCPPS